MYNESCPEISRRQFLHGEIKGGPSPLRPPWALPEGSFIQACERCDSCISACPENILRRAVGRYPEVEFSAGGCTFCGDCAKACDHGALTFAEDPQRPPWRLAVAVRESCLSLRGTVCRSCGEACEEQAIRFRLEVGGVARPLLDAQECNGCGACVSVCPVDAIAIRPEPNTNPARARGGLSSG